ncbi:MAG TPA: hypothetical protein VFZ01_02515 [Geminicoccaceae bacterium]
MIKLSRRASPVPLTSPLAVVAMLVLAGCQTPELVAGHGVEGGWRVVERTGDARTGDPSTGRSQAVDTGAILAGGSLVMTGTASRLILARDQDQISLGPAARLVLPDASEDVLLEQQQGAVRYWIRAERAPPLAIRTPTGRGESARGSFEIAIAPDRGQTTFEVAEGTLRVAAFDERRGVTIGAGQSAEAGAAGKDRLAFRRGAGQPLEPVAPSLLPVEAPEVPPATPAVGHAEVRSGIPSGEAGARSVLQATAVRIPVPPPRRPAVTPPGAPAVLLVAEAPHTVAPLPDAVPVPAPVAAEQPRERIILPAGYAANRSGPPGNAAEPGARAETGERPAPAPGFDRLVDGLLEGLDRDTPAKLMPRPR